MSGKITRRRAQNIVSPNLRQRARNLRQQQTLAEKRAWQFLKKIDLPFGHFRRQHPIASYIVDFAWLAGKIIVEIDGAMHDFTQPRDHIRQRYLENLGYRIYRLQNQDIADDHFDFAAWWGSIMTSIATAPPPLIPPPRGRETNKISSPAKKMTTAQIVEFFTILRAQNPEPKTELHYTNPYTLLVAVVLSAQATDKGVNKATAALFQQTDTPQKMLTLGEAGLKQHIKTIGLFNAKAKNIIALSQKLLADYGGQVPDQRADLESLPGVGRKTANVVLNCAFGQPTMAVDTHVFRLANRTGLAVGKNPLAVEQNLLKRIPAEFLHNAHHWLILHGRYVCKAQTPLCGNCPVRSVCGYGAKNQ